MTGGAETDADAAARTPALWAVAVPVAVILLAAWLGEIAFHGETHAHIPLHATIETIGASAAWVLAFLMVAMLRFDLLEPAYGRVAVALAAMGTLDAAHAATAAGDLFVWYHSAATLAGGLLMGSVAVLPPPAKARRPGMHVAVAIAAATGFALLSPVLADVRPAMLSEGAFTTAAQVLNVGGGLGFAAAGIHFLRTGGDGGDIGGTAALSCHCFLFAGAAMLFEVSRLWGFDWWAWHAVRVVAYLVLLLHFSRVLLRRFREQRDAQRRIRDFARVSTDWFWETGPDHRFTYLSDRFEEITGENPQLFLGRTREEFAAGNLDTPFWRRHREILDNRLPMEDIVYERPGLDGRRLTLSLSAVPLFDDRGEFLGYRGTCRNVTAQREAADELVHRKEAAERANRVKSEFLAHMSHELRTPLNTILGFADAMRVGVAGPMQPDRYRGYVDDIHGAGRHLLQMIDDILDLSKIEAGEHMAEEAVERVDVLLLESLRLAGGARTTLAASVEVRCPPAMPQLRCDGRVVRQILINLLTNATKFTPPDGAITLSAVERPDGGIDLAVADTGIGIAPEDIPRVLEPFGQVRSDAHVAHGGTGLGLPLCKRLTELHGGVFELHAEPGVGTTATVRFPPERSVRD